MKVANKDAFESYISFSKPAEAELVVESIESPQVICKVLRVELEPQKISSRPSIEGTVGCKPVPILMDSGADPNVLSEAFYLKHKHEWDSRFSRLGNRPRDPSIKLMGVSHEASSVRIIHLPVRIGSFTPLFVNV